jgi:hypothetical protein
VILRVTVPAGVLQPGRDDQSGFLEPARLLAADPGAVATGAGHPGPGLQVVQHRSVGPVQDVLELLLPFCPVGGCLMVPGLAGSAFVFADGNVQDRDGLGERDRDVGVGGGLAGRLGHLAFQLDPPLGGGVRPGGHQPGQVIDELQVTAARAAELVPGPRIDLLVDRVVVFMLDDLAVGQTQRLGTQAPPLAG